MPTWLRIALIIVLVLVLWWLVATLGRGVAEQDAPPPAGTGMLLPVSDRLVT